MMGIIDFAQVPGANCGPFSGPVGVLYRGLQESKPRSGVLQLSDTF